MPSHQERREPLPKGYQFGDAHEHDYRAHWNGETYRALCACGHDAGIVVFPSDWEIRVFESFEWPSFDAAMREQGWNDVERGEH